LRLHRPGDLRRAEAAKGAAGCRMRKNRPRMDFGIRGSVRTASQVIRFGHDPLCDVGVGPDQKVGLDVLKEQIAGSSEAGTDVNLRRRTSNSLERLFQAEHQSARAAGTQRQVRHQGLELWILLAAESTARVRCEHAYLRQRQIEELRHDLLQQEWMLDRTPNSQTVFVCRRNKTMRLDGKMRDHRKKIGIIDNQVRIRGVNVAPAKSSLFQDVS